MKLTKTFDVAVIGGGPAGASASIRLAQLSFDVALFDRGETARQHVGESLPSSIRVVLETLGVELPADVVVTRPPEHRVYWGEMRGSLPWTGIPDRESSLLVWRGPFDRFLRERAASLTTFGETPVRRAVRAEDGWRLETPDGSSARARILVDASGRSGQIARTLRERERRFRTLALTRHYRTGERSPPTVIEAFENGFAWSAPLRNGLRDVTVMLDPPAAGSDREALYQRSIEATTEVRQLVARAAPFDRVRGIDATPYRARRYCGPDFFLVGDAASFIDPLSAHGVHKAIDSALAAAVCIRTILERPERAEDAVSFYQVREENIVQVTAERLRGLYRQETRFAASAFWRKRASGPEPGTMAMTPTPAPLSASDALRAPATVRLEEAPVLEGDFIERREVLVGEGRERALRFLGPVALPDVYKEVLSSPSVGEAAQRSPLGFERAFAAIDWLYRWGYLERCEADEV